MPTGRFLCCAPFTTCDIPLSLDDPIVQRPRTPPLHGGNTGSNPVRVALVNKSLNISNLYRYSSSGIDRRGNKIWQPFRRVVLTSIELQIELPRVILSDALMVITRKIRSAKQITERGRTVASQEPRDDPNLRQGIMNSIQSVFRTWRSFAKSDSPRGNDKFSFQELLKKQLNL